MGSHFTFKKFTLCHEKSAMKIGMDGVLLGCWPEFSNPKNILDIGAGCGVITAVLQQRFPLSNVLGIEPNETAYKEAQENIAQFDTSRVRVQQTRLQDFATATKFDLILSNPPFFEKTTDNMDLDRAMARQQVFLPIDDLFYHVGQLLSNDGLFCCVYPVQFYERVVEQAKLFGLFLIKKTQVKGTPTAAAKRHLLAFSKKYAPTQESEIIVEYERNVYHPSYTKFVQDFYLHF